MMDLFKYASAVPRCYLCVNIKYKIRKITMQRDFPEYDFPERIVVWMHQSLKS